MKKIIAVLCAVLVIVCAVVWAKNEYSCRIPINNRGISGVLSEGDLDALFIGSSTFRSNIDVDMMDRDYGKSYILSYGGNQYVAADIQYDEIKSRTNSNYDLIILEFDPLLLLEKVKISDSRVIWDLSFDGKNRLWKKMAESGDADLALAYEFYVTSGIDDLFTYPITERVYATRYNKGAKTGIVESSGKEYLENEEFDISDLELVAAQEEAVRELISKAKADNQRIIFIESPHYYRLEEDEVYQKYHSYFRNIMDENGVECIYAKDVDFDNHNPEYFEDMSHMSTKGKEEYTRGLIEKIK